MPKHVGWQPRLFDLTVNRRARSVPHDANALDPKTLSIRQLKLLW